mmetsp:Transcript_25627/g.45506  ORF Transcript_25627/g.45506 Transcript_25627/m.45506 type:complete len:127 (+) Transcript_25627:68-448(+)
MLVRLVAIGGALFASVRLLNSRRSSDDDKKNNKKKSGVEIMQERNRKMYSEQSVKNGLNFIPRDGDVFISTYAKCGTTWTMQILHQLRSKGDMDFEEITAVIPWDIGALDCGQDLNTDHKYSPRLI